MLVDRLINPLTLCDEMAAAGYEYQALGTVDGVLIGYLPGGVTEAVSDDARAVLDAHDPAPLRELPPTIEDRLAVVESLLEPTVEARALAIGGKAVETVSLADTVADLVATVQQLAARVAALESTSNLTTPTEAK